MPRRPWSDEERTYVCEVCNAILHLDESKRHVWACKVIRDFEGLGDVTNDDGPELIEATVATPFPESPGQRSLFGR